jgi:hypothetical protein
MIVAAMGLNLSESKETEKWRGAKVREGKKKIRRA